MKFIWEPEDVRTGRTYSRRDIGETWLIGYLPHEESSAHFVSVSMSDGLVTLPKTRDALAQTLTSEGYVPSEILQAMQESQK